MNQLGYSPNHAARALRNGQFRTIGVITQKLERTGETFTTSAVVEEAAANDYSVTLIQIQQPESANLKDASYRLSHQAIDGLIVLRAGHATYESLALPRGLPVVVSDTRLVGYYPSVTADQVGGTREAIQHLLSLGHRNVHHIAGALDSQPAVVRAATWERVLQESGLRPPRAWQGDWTARSGYQVGQQIAGNTDITAVYCSNDEMAFGLIRALSEQGIRVPEDVSVVGFDNVALSEYYSPPLTTVRQDFQELGRELIHLLLDQITNGITDGQNRVIIPSELIVRGTTAPPRQR